MKVLKINPQPTFSPIKIMIVVETDEEKNDLKKGIKYVLEEVEEVYIPLHRFLITILKIL